jgi:hypothetical protein
MRRRESRSYYQNPFRFAADDQAPVAQQPKLTPRGQDVDVSSSCNDKISSAFKDLNEGVKVRGAQLLFASGAFVLLSALLLTPQYFQRVAVLMKDWIDLNNSRSDEEFHRAITQISSRLGAFCSYHHRSEYEELRRRSEQLKEIEEAVDADALHKALSNVQPRLTKFCASSHNTVFTEYQANSVALKQVCSEVARTLSGAADSVDGENLAATDVVDCVRNLNKYSLSFKALHDSTVEDLSLDCADFFDRTAKQCILELETARLVQEQDLQNVVKDWKTLKKSVVEAYDDLGLSNQDNPCSDVAERLCQIKARFIELRDDVVSSKQEIDRLSRIGEQSFQAHVDVALALKRTLDRVEIEKEELREFEPTSEADVQADSDGGEPPTASTISTLDHLGHPNFPRMFAFGERGSASFQNNKRGRTE